MNPVNLLKIEYLKFSNSRSVIILLLFLIINGIAQFAIFGFSSAVSQITQADLAKVAEDGLKVYFLKTHFLPAIFIVLLVISNVGNEFLQGTLRRNIIDGFSRFDYLLSKLFLILLVSALVFLIALVEIITVGTLLRGIPAGDLFSGLSDSILIRSYVLFVIYAIIGFFIITLTRNSSTGIVLFLSSIVAEKLLSVIDTFSQSANFATYLPYYVLDQTIQVASLSWGQILSIILYTAVMMFSSGYLLVKRDL